MDKHRHKFNYIIKGLISMLSYFIISCSNLVLPEYDKSDSILCPSIMTRGGESLSDGTTFRFLLFHPDLGNYVNSGTYYYNSGSEYLVASDLDDSGVHIQDNVSAGLNGVIGTYKTVAVSPGLPIINSGQICGIKTTPNKSVDGTDAGAFYTSQLETKKLGEYSIMSFDSKLIDTRAKIGFSIYRGEGMAQDISITSISLSGAGDGTEDGTVYYYPVTRQCAVAESSSNQMTFSPTRISNENGTYYFKTESKFITAGIYAPQDITAEILGSTYNIIPKSYLSLNLQYKQGSEDKDVNIILNADAARTYAELKAMNEYNFKITISSTYINIQLHVFDHTSSSDWQSTNSDMDMSFGNDNNMVNIGIINIGNWNNVDYGNQEFIN